VSVAPLESLKFHGHRSSEEIRYCFYQLLPAPHNPITRTLDHRIYYGAVTLACSPKISPDPDNFLFGRSFILKIPDLPCCAVKEETEYVYNQNQLDCEIMNNTCILWGGDLPLDQYPVLGIIPMPVVKHLIELAIEDGGINLSEYSEIKHKISIPNDLYNVDEVRAFLREVRKVFLEYFSKGTCFFSNCLGSCEECWLHAD
jgi:hypothetical protein